jgi:hypothetical protein
MLAVGEPLIEQVIAAELLENTRIRRLKSRGMWAMTCSIINVWKMSIHGEFYYC